ncbi:hypothetical protein [Sulfitobacter sp.]
MPAYDFHGGNLRIWMSGKVVAEFPPSYFANIILDLVKQMAKRDSNT